MANYKPLPSQKTLQHHFNYDPDKGLFYWKNPTSPRTTRGSVAGKTHHLGYKTVRFLGKDWALHRFAWMFVYGEDPGELQIDHINGVCDDNRLSNLRVVTEKQNHYNRWGKGFQKRKDGSYRAEICVDYKRIHLGTFKSAKEARQAYLNAKQKHHSIH
jgi:hypothetical protein